MGKIKNRMVAKSGMRLKIGRNLSMILGQLNKQKGEAKITPPFC